MSGVVVISLPVPIFLLCGIFLTAGMVGCASDESPMEEKVERRRIDQILSPEGANPKESYTKRSRYDGQDFKSGALKGRSFRGAQGKAREGGKDFNMAGTQTQGLTGKRSRFESESAREGGEKARTFASRYEDQAARTNAFAGANESYRTNEAREAGDRYYSGQRRGYSTRTLESGQLSPTARETAQLYSVDLAAPMNEESVRRVLNKAPRE
jgi:hypothetical protein